MSKSLRDLGHLSQKVNLFGGVAQILIYSRVSPCLADVGLFVRHLTQQFSSNKELLSIVRTNSPISVRFGDDLRYINVWTTPRNMLTFWDGAPSLISGISAISQTLNWMCRRYLRMDRVQAIAPLGQGNLAGGWAGWLASYSDVMVGRPKEARTLYLRGDC